MGTKSVLVQFALAFLISQAAAAASGSAGSDPGTVAGILRLNPVTASSYLAAWVPVPDGMNLAGVRWYNNDELAVFPEVLALYGSEVGLADVGDCTLLAENVAGASSGWTELAFSQPIACGGDGAYLLFRLPEGNAAIADGVGGGAGIGYLSGNGVRSWVTVDGANWVGIDRACGLALEPVVAATEPGTAGKNSTSRGPVGAPSTESVRFETALKSIAPNPFNPDTEIQFTLGEQTHVSIVVYDVSGRRVASLADGPMELGAHVVNWAGRDESGRSAASGVYFVHMVAGSQSFSRRMSLVR